MNFPIPFQYEYSNNVETLQYSGKGKTKEERKQLLAERKPPIILMTDYAHEGLFFS